VSLLLCAFANYSCSFLKAHKNFVHGRSSSIYIYEESLRADLASYGAVRAVPVMF